MTNSPCIEHLDTNRYRCRNRGFVITTDVLPIHCCPSYDGKTADDNLQPIAQQLADETHDPTIVDQIKHYAAALWRWNAAGRPVRSDEEVARLHAICRACEHLSEAGTCRKCGCRVNQSKIAVLNKIRMATETCPKEKWDAPAS